MASAFIVTSRRSTRSTPKPAQTATASATRKKAMPGARTFFIIGITSYHKV